MYEEAGGILAGQHAINMNKMCNLNMKRRLNTPPGRIDDILHLILTKAHKLSQYTVYCRSTKSGSSIWILDLLAFVTKRQDPY